jgi:hypothetical protein
VPVASYHLTVNHGIRFALHLAPSGHRVNGGPGSQRRRATSLGDVDRDDAVVAISVRSG